MVYVPAAAVGAITRVAAIWEVVCGPTLAVIPVAGCPLASNTSRLAKDRLVPVTITGSLIPVTPCEGVILVNWGASGRTINVVVTAPPSGVLMVMICGPSGAIGLMSKVTLIWAAVVGSTTQPVVVMPVGRVRIASVKLVPVKVTGTLVPTTPTARVMPVSVGGGKAITVESFVLAVGELTRDALALLTSGVDAACTFTATVING